jgi:hypothetical protein
MQTASAEMMMASGQYQAEMGAPSNEQSGKAIQQRQRQGDNATYHFIDNYGNGIRQTGKILVDLIPKIYDTPRVIRILGEDGSDDSVTVDTNASGAITEQPDPLTQKVQRIFNPAVGKYDVEADIGPAYGTQRQAAFEALSQIMAQNPEMMKTAGDLLWMSADFPLADKLAERFKRLIPPEVLGEGPSPEQQKTQAQVQAMQGTIQQLLKQLADKETELRIKGEQKEIDAFEAMTKRLELQLKTILSPKEVAMMVHEMAKSEHAAQIDTVAMDSTPEFPEEQREAQTPMEVGV